MSPLPLNASLDDDTRAATLNRDVTCRITNSYTPLERAHIIPSNENPWFKANAMGFYTGPGRIDSLHNSIALRKDVHYLWDKMETIPFPKKRADIYYLVSHAFKTCRASDLEIEQLYHNRECQELYDVSREFLFARFAWSIFRANTITLHTAEPGPFTLLLSAKGTKYPQAKVEEVMLASQIPLPTLPHSDPPDSGSPSEKRSLSRTSRNRWYYSVDNQIQYLDSDGDDKPAKKDVYWYYSIDNQIVYLDSDGDSLSYGAVDTDDDSKRVGRKRRRSDSSGSESTPPFSQSLITVSSGGQSNSIIASPLVAKAEKEVVSDGDCDVTNSTTMSNYQVAMRNVEGV
ncbi:hypothetical protein F4814DRAFT_423466 [Daldinia grandis]|nr:hypothetical protein F4814DRAFT_423466 [Daldinia grandis]